MHSVSSVFVDHIRAVESSEPVTSMLLSSESAMQLMLGEKIPFRFFKKASFLIFPKIPFIMITHCLLEGSIFIAGRSSVPHFTNFLCLWIFQSLSRFTFLSLLHILDTRKVHNKVAKVNIVVKQRQLVILNS